MTDTSTNTNGTTEVTIDHTSDHPAYTTGEVVSLSSQHP
jgi:hypothetical protein